MAIFAVIPLDQTAANNLAPIIEREFPGKNVLVKGDHWLITSGGTSQELATKLGITAGQLGEAIVYNVSGYFGYAPQSIWEWLKSNLSSGAAAGG
jgi:hypothetical protein